jgi:hypothetical protein
MASHLPRRSLCIEAELWERFGNAVEATSPELTRSMALRELVRWWIDPDVTGLPSVIRTHWTIRNLR